MLLGRVPGIQPGEEGTSLLSAPGGLICSLMAPAALNPPPNVPIVLNSRMGWEGLQPLVPSHSSRANPWG